MTALRLIILLLCLGGGGWHLERERQAGRLRQVDEWFLDFLTANARERLETPDPAAAPEVALVTLRERDRAEYAAWPPPPLDWRTILQGLAPFEPDVLVVAAPLNWGQPAPDFLPALAEALLAFPSVVLGMEAQWQDVPPPHAPFLGGLEDQLPRLSNVSGDAELAPSLKALVTAPDPALLGQSELGVLAVRAEGGGWRLPYALRAGDALVPALAAQALARRVRTPYALHRLRLGPGAGAFLEQGRFVPLAVNGEMRVSAPAEGVPEVSALGLMTGTLAEGLPAVEKQALSGGRIIVIGIEAADGACEARLLARALAGALALPRLRVLTLREQWAVWAASGLAAAWLVLRVRRGRALSAGAGLMFAALVAVFLVFQSALIWCPPTMPVFALASGALIARIFGRAGAGNAAPQPEKAP